MDEKHITRAVLRRSSYWGCRAKRMPPDSVRANDLHARSFTSKTAASKTAAHMAELSCRGLPQVAKPPRADTERIPYDTGCARTREALSADDTALRVSKWRSTPHGALLLSTVGRLATRSLDTKSFLQDRGWDRVRRQRDLSSASGLQRHCVRYPAYRLSRQLDRSCVWPR